MAFVVDNSVVSGWFLASQTNAYTNGVLALMRNDTEIVPPLWEFELANVVRTAVARNILSEKDARLAISYILGLPISVDRTAVTPDRRWPSRLRMGCPRTMPPTSNWRCATNCLSPPETAD